MIRVVAVAHDPGGANAVATTTATLRARGIAVEAVAKGPAQNQFRRLAVAFTPFADGSVEAALDGGAALLLTGTSAADAVERESITAARARSIPSVSVVDYWVNHRVRFAPDGNWTLPDRVVAIDELCRAALVADGVPGETVVVLGQPYFSALLARPRRARATASGPVERLFFASEPGLGSLAALDAVIEALAAVPAALTVRFHPRERERAERLERLACAGLAFTVDDGLDPLASVAAHDAVVGISSMILIESQLLGVATAGFGGGIEALARYRLIAPVRDAGDVIAFLRAPHATTPDPAFLESQRDAAARVADLCLALALQ